MVMCEMISTETRTLNYIVPLCGC